MGREKVRGPYLAESLSLRAHPIFLQLIPNLRISFSPRGAKLNASMALPPSLNYSLGFSSWNGSKIRACSTSINPPINSTSSQSAATKRCLRCRTIYSDLDNSPSSCAFHGHITGERGLFSLSPPHQGIDGEWSDGSGVIVYKWNEKDNRPNTGNGNWKRRWSCCSEYDEHAPPCRRGWHVSYDDGFTLF